jgi:DNA repair protein RecO (recombination protein O)
MKTIRTPAIVLRRTNYGEADRILSLLTPDGKRNVIARGARREKSKLAGGIELFAICEVVIAEGKGELAILTSSRLVHFYRNIMSDYDRMQFGYVVIKLVSGASEMVEGPEWYDVLYETLMGLDAHTIHIAVVQTWFYLRYAALMGYELSLVYDLKGEKLSVEKTYRYDVTEKGLATANNGELTSEHIKLLRIIATKPLRTVAQIGGLSEIIGECLSVSRQHAAV